MCVLPLPSAIGAPRLFEAIMIPDHRLRVSLGVSIFSRTSRSRDSLGSMLRTWHSGVQGGKTEVPNNWLCASSLHSTARRNVLMVAGIW